MSEPKKTRVNIFKHFWQMTGGGFVSLLSIILILACILFLCGIGIWSVSTSSNHEAVDSSSAAVSDQTKSDENESGEQSEEGSNDQTEEDNTESNDDDWVENLDENDSTNIGNRVNTTQLPDSSFIYEVSIEELASADSYLDEQTVQVTGEVVGDRINDEQDQDRCWITLQSQDPDDNEVSVNISKSASKAIDTYGSYSKEGTSLQVRGTFYLASTQRQGASMIYAESVSVVSSGKMLEDEGSLESLVPGIIMLLVGGILMLTFNILRERQR